MRIVLTPCTMFSPCAMVARHLATHAPWGAGARTYRHERQSFPQGERKGQRGQVMRKTKLQQKPTRGKWGLAIWEHIGAEVAQAGNMIRKMFVCRRAKDAMQK